MEYLGIKTYKLTEDFAQRLKVDQDQLTEERTLNQIVELYKNITEYDNVPTIVDSGDTLWLTEDGETYDLIATLERSYDDYGRIIDRRCYNLYYFFHHTNECPIICSKFIHADTLDDAYRRWFEEALNFYHSPDEPIERRGKIEHYASCNWYEVSMTVTPVNGSIPKNKKRKKV